MSKELRLCKMMGMKNRKKIETRVGTRTSPGLNGQEKKRGKEEIEKRW